MFVENVHSSSSISPTSGPGPKLDNYFHSHLFKTLENEKPSLISSVKEDINKRQTQEKQKQIETFQFENRIGFRSSPDPIDTVVFIKEGRLKTPEFGPAFEQIHSSLIEIMRRKNKEKNKIFPSSFITSFRLKRKFYEESFILSLSPDQTDI